MHGLTSFLLMYFNAKIYLPISILIFFSILIFSKFKNFIDIDKIFDEIREELEKLRESSERIANFFEYVINESLAGNRIPVYIVLFIACLIPIFRVLLLITSIKDVLDNN